MASLITMIGTVGMGLVWGWLLLLIGGRGQAKRPFLTPFFLFLATFLVTVYLFLLTTLAASILFLIAALLTAFFHLAWQQELRRRS